MTKKQTKTSKKPEPFRHTAREIAILNRAHVAMMANINAGRHYDVVKRAWVDENGNAV